MFECIQKQANYLSYLNKYITLTSERVYNFLETCYLDIYLYYIIVTVATRICIPHLS